MNIALVGCGRISKRHIEAISTVPELKIAAVCDIIPEKAQILAQTLGDIPWFSDYNGLCGMDVISVLTPSGMHPRHAIEIAESTDAKYIIVEKPVSLTVREAQELFFRVEKTGKKLLAVYQNRYNPLVVLMKKLISSGKLGRIYMAECNVLWNRDDDYFKIDWHGTSMYDGGVLYTQASHYVDMLHFFFGEVEQYRGIGGLQRGLEVFDSLCASMKFKNGTLCSLNTTVGVYEKNYMTEFTLIAENGTIRLDGTNLNHIAFWNVKDMPKPDMDFTLDHVYGKGHDVLYRNLADSRLEMFPNEDDVISGIRLMEQLSY